MRINPKLATLALLVSALISDSALAISPPWYRVQKLYANSVGASPCVTVRELTNRTQRRYNLRIDACEDQVAEALTSVFRRRWKLGGVTLIVKVYDSQGKLVIPGTSQTLKERFNNALKDNPYIHKVHTVNSPLTHLNMVAVECKKEIIQFWNDNIGDLYGNENYVAADVFREITSRKFRGINMFAGWSTYMAPQK
ncbi:MAG: hypothetical protein GX589_06785 [Deltaproteobacteria bacterium]|nr:hypothetical protein [Deltaproteobacteria bacterium]